VTGVLLLLGFGVLDLTSAPDIPGGRGNGGGGTSGIDGSIWAFDIDSARREGVRGDFVEDVAIGNRVLSGDVGLFALALAF
jgi:hypothetical protein